MPKSIDQPMEIQLYASINPNSLREEEQLQIERKLVEIRKLIEILSKLIGLMQNHKRFTQCQRSKFH